MLQQILPEHELYIKNKMHVTKFKTHLEINFCVISSFLSENYTEILC